MKLSVELVARELARTHRVRVHGTASRELTLHRPELLEPSACELIPHHLYVGRTDQLPQRVRIGADVALVVVGSSPRLRWFRERCSVLEVEEPCDLPAVFNEVQRLFQRYAHWEESLWEILDDDSSIQALLDASASVLDGSLDVLDANLRLLGQTISPDASRERASIADEGGNLYPDSMNEFLSQHDLAMDVSTPFVMAVSGVSTLNANLLDNGTYLGCLTQIVMALLAEMVLRALRRLDVTAEKTKGDLRRSLAALVAAEQLDALSLSALAAERGSYVCLKMRLNSRGRQLPLSYVRNLVEDNLPDTVAFVHQRSYVVAFSRLDGLAPEGERRAALERLLAPMTDSIGMRVGISDQLLGLESARTYYLQAGVALELGMALDPKGTVYRFQQYALPELIMNSLGELPVEAYYTPGLRRLLEHDGHSSVSYIDTLERYLSLNMNVSATARELYLHRSTLIERLSRIREDMGQELDDPKTRLRIQLLLEARGLERSLGELGAT